jgi:hypothetical protein
VRKKEEVLRLEERGVGALEKVKGLLVSGGKSLSVWDRDCLVWARSMDAGIKCMKFNFLTESLYLGCSDANVIVLHM